METQCSQNPLSRLLGDRSLNLIPIHFARMFPSELQAMCISNSKELANGLRRVPSLRQRCQFHTYGRPARSFVPHWLGVDGDGQVWHNFTDKFTITDLWTKIRWLKIENGKQFSKIAHPHFCILRGCQFVKMTPVSKFNHRAFCQK